MVFVIREANASRPQLILRSDFVPEELKDFVHVIAAFEWCKAGF